MSDSRRSRKMSKKMARMAARSGKESSEMSSDLETESSVDRDWRESRTVAQCVSHLCFSEHLSDISFTFDDDKSVKLPAHKFVLSMRSDVFEAMFYGYLAEGGETVFIKDVKPDVMKTILRFVYTDKPEIDGKNVLPCLYAAKKYNLSGLVKQCSNFLQNNIDENNVCQIIEHAIFYQMNPLQERCLAFIIENASSVLCSQGFMELSHATLLNILKRDELASDEIDVFKAAVKWAEHNCESKSGQNMRDQLGEALFEIRFPNIPIEDFARVVTPSGILTKEELLTLYEFNATKGSTPLGNFRQGERPGTLITVNLGQYKYEHSLSRMGRSSACYLNIQGYNNRLRQNQLFSNQVKPINKSVKLKAVTGTFVESVTGIANNGVHIHDYKTNGDKLIFMTPIDISDNISIEFNFSNENQNDFGFRFSALANHFSYTSDIQENVKGQNIIITNIPDGLETITFV
ncbi:BTB/POZ domain-containing protein 6-B-like [Ruditapes philippinarum]|uniref:BTB/POZ domain-containing protein 6-B-like n=1 Tax=Ruditapes philippinarum TaxID=129788 RepID=UPI00295C2BB2|nr:BTB/POZ domain-containing protein 6-B-like [Ruditapes philippinarum]